VLYRILLSYLLNVKNHFKSVILQFQFLLRNRQCLVELGQGNRGMTEWCNPNLDRRILLLINESVGALSGKKLPMFQGLPHMHDSH